MAVDGCPWSNIRAYRVKHDNATPLGGPNDAQSRIGQMPQIDAGIIDDLTVMTEDRQSRSHSASASSICDYGGDCHPLTHQRRVCDYYSNGFQSDEIRSGMVRAGMAGPGPEGLEMWDMLIHLRSAYAWKQERDLHLRLPY